MLIAKPDTAGESGLTLSSNPAIALNGADTLENPPVADASNIDLLGLMTLNKLVGLGKLPE